jgi:hypothetical protein
MPMINRPAYVSVNDNGQIILIPMRYSEDKYETRPDIWSEFKTTQRAPTVIDPNGLFSSLAEKLGEILSR